VATGGICQGMDNLESSKTEFSPHTVRSTFFPSPSGMHPNKRPEDWEFGRQRKRVASWGDGMGMVDH